jgi:hypothetical protein
VANAIGDVINEGDLRMSRRSRGGTHDYLLTLTLAGLDLEIEPVTLLAA